MILTADSVVIYYYFKLIADVNTYDSFRGHDVDSAETRNNEPLLNESQFDMGFLVPEVSLQLPTNIKSRKTSYTFAIWTNFPTAAYVGAHSHETPPNARSLPAQIGNTTIIHHLVKLSENKLLS